MRKGSRSRVAYSALAESLSRRESAALTQVRRTVPGRETR
ncbi:MAG: hypothetical protein ACI835_002977, partial [Planctomycetota bacterium]